MKEKFMRFMQGRYGADQLSRFLVGIGVILFLLSTFTRIRIFYYIGIVCLIYVYVRMFSRNYQKRYAENQKYLSMTRGVRSFFQRKQGNLKQRKNFHIYKCPTCKQKIRIPKGKGKIEVSCPTCHTKFIKRS